MTTLNTPPTPGPDLQSMQQKLRARLSRLGTRVRAQIAFDALVRGLAVMLGLLALSVVIDFWLELSRPMRVIYWLVTLAAGAHFFYHYGIKPLRSRLDPVELARAMDIARGNRGTQQIAPRVATVMQLPGLVGDDEALSDQMIRDAVGRSYHSLEQTNFTAALSGKHTMQCIGILLAALLFPGAIGGVMNAVGENVLGTWAQRWLTLADTPYPRNTQIKVIGLTDDGVLVIPAGENFTLRTTITTKDGREVEDARLELRPESSKKRTEALTRFDDSDFRLDMTPLTRPAVATVSAGDQTLRFNVEPAARPRLTGLRARYSHPSDPGNVREIDFNGAEGEVSLLELNEIELRLTANVPIAEARYVDPALVSGGEQTPPPPIERAGDNTFVIKWTHTQRQRLRLELVSEDAGLVSQPIPISVGLKADRKPSVRLRSTGLGPRITPNALIPLSLESRDDYGLLDSAIELKRIRTGGDDAGQKGLDPVVLYEDPAATLKEYRGKRDLEIDEFGVRPTDVVRLTGVATDDRYTGKQTGESTMLTFRIVTHKELFREIIARQQQARAAFRQAIEDSKDIHALLLQARNGAQTVSQARRFRSIQRSVWKVGRELERSAEEMRLNRLGGDKEDGNQAYQSMKTTILDPLEKLHDQTMSAQRDALEASANAGPEDIAQLAMDQQAVVDEMNQLLLRMDRWDELLDAINQLTEVIGQQKDLQEKIKKLIEEETEDIFKE